MKVLHIGICSVALASLVGCSAMGLNNKRIDYRAGAEQVPTLEVPPDLTAPEADDRYKVAGGASESVATYSSYTKGEAAAAPARSVVLPVVTGVSIERSGAKRWLKVSDKAENVWPVVKSFLHDTGLNIKSEDQAAGIIETDWAENRAKIPQGGLRSIVGKVFNNIYSSDEQDQYSIRLERTKDGAGTEVYITHRGKEEVLAADGNTSRWQSRPNDPELEAELLQRLMVKFGGTPVQAAAATTESVAASTGAASLLQIFDGSSVIVINDTFDKSWRRAGLAIERAGYVVEDKDREKGVYFLRNVKVEKGWMDKLQFWKDEESADLHYRVNVKDGGASCEVSVTDQNGAVSEASKQRLEAIYGNINQ
jgi:outer membrane protein assembly factor BamC